MRRWLAAFAAAGPAMAFWIVCAATAVAAPPSAPQGQNLGDAFRQALKDLLTAPELAIHAGMAAGQQSNGIAGLTLDPQSQTSRTTTDQIPADAEGPAGQRSVTVSSRVEGTGSRVTVQSEYRMEQQRGSARVNARGRTRVSLDFCPDKDGRIVAEIGFDASGDDAQAGAGVSGGYSTHLSAKGLATGQVDDQAMLTGVTMRFEGEHSMRGGANVQVPGGGTQKSRDALGGGFGVESARSVEQRMPQTGASEPDAIQLNVQGRPRIDVRRGNDTRLTGAFALAAELMMEAAVKEIFYRAQAKWRDGACVELVVRPPVKGRGTPNRTQPKERRSFEVAVRHKTEQAELPMPVELTFTGRDTVEPRRGGRSPLRLDYTAGAGADDYGRVELKTVSRRGIGKDSVLFENQARLAGTVEVLTRDQMTLTTRGQVNWQPGDSPDRYVPSGSLSVEGTRQDCSVSGQGTIGAGDGQLHVQRDAQGRITQYRGMGLAMLTLHIKCPRAASTRLLAIPWLNTTMAWQPVAAGGALEGHLSDGPTRYSWRFTP